MALQKTTAFKGISANYWHPSSMQGNQFGGMNTGDTTSITYSLFLSKTFFDSLPDNSKQANVLDTKAATVASYGESLADMESALIADASSGNFFYQATIV